MPRCWDYIPTADEGGTPSVLPGSLTVLSSPGSQKSLLGECNYLSPRWISLLLTTPFFVHMDLPMELSLKSSIFSCPSSMYQGIVSSLCEGFLCACFNVANIQQSVAYICQPLCFHRVCFSFIRHEYIFEFSKDTKSSMLCFNKVESFQ